MAHIDLTAPKHYVAGGVYVKELRLEHVGDTVLSHKHAFNHLSLVAAGRVRVTVDGEVTQYTAPTALVVKAGKEHKVEALEPNSLWYCVHQVPEGLEGEDLLDNVVVSGRSDMLLSD